MIKEHYDNHQRTQLQNPEQARIVLLASEIAHCLIPEAGVVNLEIIPDIKAKLLEGENSSSYGRHLLDVLDALENSTELRKKLASVCLPTMLRAPSTALIEIAMGLPPGSILTHKHAQQCALPEIMPYGRQGKAGTCFASR